MRKLHSGNAQRAYIYAPMGLGRFCGKRVDDISLMTSRRIIQGQDLLSLLEQSRWKRSVKRRIKEIADHEHQGKDQLEEKESKKLKLFRQSRAKIHDQDNAYDNCITIDARYQNLVNHCCPTDLWAS